MDWNTKPASNAQKSAFRQLINIRAGDPSVTAAYLTHRSRNDSPSHLLVRRQRFMPLWVGMDFDLSQISQRATYNPLIGLVTPRPIALITSLDREGRVNAAPFSAYNYLGTDPAIVAIGVANRPAPGVVGRDTAQNIRNTHEFVINVVNETLPHR